MYSRREKIEQFDRLKGVEYADDDVKLLAEKIPDHPKLMRFQQVPHRYAVDILYALLDVCTAEEIEKNRKPSGSSKPLAKKPSSNTSSKKSGSSKTSTKKPSSNTSTKKNGSSKASTKKEESPTADGSSEALTDEADKTEKEDAPDAPAVTDPPATEEAKKK